MTRDSVRRRAARPSFAGLPLDPVTVVLAVIIVGVALRVFIAGVLMPWSGFRIDIGDFASWGMRLADVGPREFYTEGLFSDYPPAYMFVLWLLGTIGQAFEPITGRDITVGLVKFPGILADGGVAWLLFVIGRRWGPEFTGRWSGELIGLVAATAYLFNPGVIFNSAVWGQVDSVGTLVILGTLYAMTRGWTEAAAAGAVLAVLVKFQYGFLIPIVAIVGLKRHAFGMSSDPEHADGPDWVRVLWSLTVAVAVLIVVLVPFSMWPWNPFDETHSLWDRFTAAANTYSGLSINAFNLWRNPWSQLGDTLQWGADVPTGGADGAGVAIAIGSTQVSWQLVGFVLFGLAALAAYWHVARRDDARGILVAALVLAIAFFALPTRVHERYLFPALALGAPLLLRNWRWGLLYGVLSVSLFTNVYWVYTADWSFAGGARPMNPGVDGLPMVRDPGLQAILFNDIGIYLLSWMVPVALVVLVWRAIVAPALTEPEAEPMRRARAGPASELGAGPGTEAGAWTESAAFAEPMAWPGPIQRFRGWLRPDPADPYLREPRRRLDRWDLAIVVALILGAFVFRLWRLDTPRNMHFDEVYHARSATEWLTDWQEGWTRDTYEWTHPMLAKYLIAAGIVVADPNRIVDRIEVDTAPTALAVAPERSDYGRRQSVLFSAAGGATITARDALSGERLASWDVSGTVANLAYDGANERLLVGLADSGRVAVFALGDFMAANGERAPPAGAPPIETELASVDEIVVDENASVILFRGSDGIAEVERDTGVPIAGSGLLASAIGYVGGGEAARVVALEAGRAELLVLEADTLEPVMEGDLERAEPLPAAPAGSLVVRGTGDDTQVYVPVGALPADEEHGDVAGGITVFDKDLNLIDTAPLPGEPSLIGWQSVANIIYIAGTDATANQPAVWTVQPIGNGGSQSAGFAVFDTTILPGEPRSLAFDISDHDQDEDHAHLIVSTETPDGGVLAAVDVGSNAFAWRLSGIVFGALLAGLVFLLAATMFSRRRIAVLAGVFIALDAMSYVMSRISMNDIFAATFIAAGYLVFWQVWSGRWARSAWWALPLAGVLIGLAAATKWVGFYALIGIWVLVLARSHLGRFLLIGGLAFATVVMGIGGPWPFLALSVAALVVALLITWVRPIRLEMTDLIGLASSVVVLAGIGLAFSIAYNQVEGDANGLVEAAFAFLARGAQVGWPAWIMLGVAGVLLLLRAAVSLRSPDSDRRWYLPGELGGFAWPWVGASLAVIPLLVYFLAYVPYLQLGHHIAGPDAGPGYGWSLEELHAQMFGYHFNLQAGHVASSPWWSWPLDLKTVFFYTHSFDGSRLGVIYNGGNPILFWAGIPAMVWIGLQAWRRRSMALSLLVVAFAFQYLPWARIERATFQYHYLAALPFAMVAVAYALDEGLRSWSWRPLAMAFAVLAVVAGVLVFPLGAALAMPDWYINAARAFWPWNYAFVFPSPPTETRELVATDTAKLFSGMVIALLAAGFALFGRVLFGGPAEGAEQQEGAQQDQDQGPESVELDLRQPVARQEVETDPDEEQPEDRRAPPR